MVMDIDLAHAEPFRNFVSLSKSGRDMEILYPLR